MNLIISVSIVASAVFSDFVVSRIELIGRWQPIELLIFGVFIVTGYVIFNYIFGCTNLHTRLKRRAATIVLKDSVANHIQDDVLGVNYFDTK